MFGVALLLSGQKNPGDAKSLARDAAEPGNDSITVNAKAWMHPYYIWKTMLGPTISIPVGGKKEWLLTAGVMAGLLKTSEPWHALSEGYTYHPSSGSTFPGGLIGGSYSTIANSSFAWVPAFMGSVGIQRRITKRINIRADADFFSVTLKTPMDYYRINSYPFYTFSGGNGTPVVATPTGRIPRYTIPVSALNFTAGIAFRL